MGNVAHVEKEMKDLVKDVHCLDLLAVRLISIFEDGVKEKQDSDPIELKGALHDQRVEVLSQREMVYFATRVDCVFLMWVS